MLTEDEKSTAEWLANWIAPIMPDDWAFFTEFAGHRMAAGRQPTVPERLWFGQVVLSFCITWDSFGLQHLYAESLYRKLWGHDRATMSPAPYPSLPGRELTGPWLTR